MERDSPLRYLAELKDPRLKRTREHLLEEILLVAIAAILSGAGGWNEIEHDGKAKIDWLRSFPTLPAGIPSHNTVNRVLRRWIRASWRRALRPGSDRSRS